uniref:Uncharacterized protein n=1 Tax=Vitis vinifera TaxID=29760 RepID=F6GVK6_VITVI
MGSPASESQGL